MEGKDMVTKQTDINTGDFEARLQKLEKRVAVLEKRAGNLKKKARKTREYTPEEKAAVRERLLAGQEAAREKRGTEAQAEKTVKQRKLS